MSAEHAALARSLVTVCVAVQHCIDWDMPDWVDALRAIDAACPDRADLIEVIAELGWMVEHLVDDVAEARRVPAIEVWRGVAAHLWDEGYA